MGGGLRQGRGPLLQALRRRLRKAHGTASPSHAPSTATMPMSIAPLSTLDNRLLVPLPQALGVPGQDGNPSSSGGASSGGDGPLAWIKSTLGLK